jgi:hypothetical protein
MAFCSLKDRPRKSERFQARLYHSIPYPEHSRLPSCRATRHRATKREYDSEKMDFGITDSQGFAKRSSLLSVAEAEERGEA